MIMRIRENDMELKQNEMDILATVLLNEKDEDIYINGEITFIYWHDENETIDYDYLNQQVLFLEEKLHDKLLYTHENLLNVSLNVKQWKIGTDIYTVLSHSKKLLKKTKSKEHLRLVK